MTLIDGDRIITTQEYDDEHEEFIDRRMSIIDYINIYTHEGVTEEDVIKPEEWIPVSKRLPKVAGVYRVTRRYLDNVMNPHYIVTACFFDGSNTWYNDIKVNHERPYADNVIAWQEDPKPYEIGVIKNDHKTKSKEI